MARYHDIDTELWEDLIDLPPRQKLLYIYLFSCPSCRPSGLFKISQKTIKHHTDATESDLRGINGVVIDYDFATQEVFVRGKLKRILSGFKNNPKMRLAIQHDFEHLESVFLKSLFIKKYEGALEGLVSPPLPLPLPLALALEDKSVREETKRAFDLDAPILYLNEKAGRKFDPKNQTNREIIRARMVEGRNLDDFKRIVDLKVSQWNSDERMAGFLRPETLFCKKHFESYLNEPEQKISGEELLRGIFKK